LPIHELFHKYKDLSEKDILLTVGQVDIPVEQKIRLIRLIECHQNTTFNNAIFENSIAYIANQTIDNLNENEWVGQTVGKHKIKSVINSGGTGVVFFGEKGGDYIQKAAVKLIDPTITKMIGQENVLNEAQLMASMNHPGIAKIYDSGRLKGGIIYFIMEYVEGKRLTELIQGELTVKQVVKLSIDLCSAIAHAHELQITHKDLKPDNILIGKDFEVKVIDFGLSKSNNKVNDNHSDFYAVSKEYASPEQLAKKVITSRTDIYSIGCCIFEAITGDKYINVFPSPDNATSERLYKGTVFAYVSSRASLKAKFSSRTSMLELSAIVEKAVQNDPLNRYKTVDALAHDLERLSQSYPVVAFKPKSVPIYHFTKFVRRNPAIVAMGVVLFTAFIGFSVATKNQLVVLQNEQENVNQVLSNFKGLLVHTDPRERLGEPISIKEVLARELDELLLNSESNMSPHVKYELLMTIGEGLLGHGKGVEAEKAFVHAISSAELAFGKKSIEVVAATVKLTNAYAQKIYYDEILNLVKPYFDDIFVEKFTDIEYARLFIVFNKINSRFFTDAYKELRFEDPIQTLRKIAINYKEQLEPMEVIDLELTILKNTFYSMVGDYASPTAHVPEIDVIENRIPVLKPLIPELDKLIALARDNRNTQFVLPDLLSWRARLAYETKDYAKANTFYVEALALAKVFFDEADFRLSNVYLYGSVIFRFHDTEKALYYASKSLDIDFTSLNMEPSEYLDNMSMYLDFVFINGDFDMASAEVIKALAIAEKIGLEYLTPENISAMVNVLDSYYIYSHPSTNLINNSDVKKYLAIYNRCYLNIDRVTMYCDLIDYIHNGDAHPEKVKQKVNLVLSAERVTGKRDHEVIYHAMINLQQVGAIEQSAQYIPLLEKHTNWSDLEKTNSVEYLAIKSFTGLTNLKTGRYKEAKDDYLHALSILNKHYDEESAYVAIIYTGLAELSFIEGDYVMTKKYIDKTNRSFALHFDSTSPVTIRMRDLQKKLENDNL
jgi:serine/threonine protein kinase/tetratricopeptide (TPR) repeat protein